MNEPTINNVVQRVDRLERENRRMKLAGVLMLLGVAAVMVMGQAKTLKTAKEIEAERFVVKDEDGKVRVVLGLQPKWQGNVWTDYLPKEERFYGMYIYNQDGDARVRLYHNRRFGNKSALELWSRRVKSPSEWQFSKVELWTDVTGASLNIEGYRMGGAVSIRASTLGDTYMTLDEKGSTRVILGHTTLVHPRTEVKEKRPLSSMVLFDQEGKTIWKAP